VADKCIYSRTVGGAIVFGAIGANYSLRNYQTIGTVCGITSFFHFASMHRCVRRARKGSAENNGYDESTFIGCPQPNFLKCRRNATGTDVKLLSSSGKNAWKGRSII
jgi:hypothetical protein